MVSPKQLTFWLVGSVCIFLGALIAGSIEPGVLGSTQLSIMISYIISFVLILVGGMFWISVHTAE